MNGSKNHLSKFRIRKYWKILCEVEGLVYRCCYLESKRLPLVALSYGLMKQLVTLILCVVIHAQVYSQSVPSYVPTNGLVGWWGFNGNAQDGSGNGNHGTVSQTSYTTNRFGVSGNSIELLTKNSYIDIPDLSSFDISYSMYYYFSGTGGDYNTLIGQPLQTYHHLLLDPTGLIGFHSNRGFFSSGVQLVVGQWYHIVCIKNGTQHRVWLNNLLIQNDISGSFLNSVYPTSIIGNTGTPFNQGSLGKLDDIGIWNRALTQQEITNLYNAQSGVAIPPHHILFE